MVILAETAVGEIDGGVGLDDFEAADGFVGEGDEIGVHLLHHLGIATQAVRDTRDDESHQRQHAEHKECQLHVDIEQHKQIEQHADDGSENHLDGAEDALFILHHVARKAGHNIALAGAVVVAHGQVHGLAEHPVAQGTDDIDADDGYLDGGEVGENVLAGIEQLKRANVILDLEQELLLQMIGEVQMIEIKGRHDRFHVPRAAVIVEAMAALTLIDFMNDVRF